MVKFITGRPGRSADMPVLFLHSSPKKAFRPAEATRCPDKREIWYGERTLTKFHVYWGINVGIQPQNCQNFEFWPEICTSGVTHLQYFLRNSQRLYASIGSFQGFNLVAFGRHTTKL